MILTKRGGQTRTILDTLSRLFYQVGVSFNVARFNAFKVDVEAIGNMNMV